MVALLENVASIDDADARTGLSNADDVKQLFASEGYLVCDSICNSFYHGVPHRRIRWWAAAVHLSTDPLTEEHIENYRDQVATFHTCLEMLCLKPVPLDDILMEEGSEEFAIWQAERLATADSEEPQEGKKKEAWPDLHAEHFRGQGVRHPPSFSLLYSSAEIDSLRCLPARAREIVYLFDTLQGRAKVEEVIDVSQSVYRIPSMEDGLPCITPKCLLWLRRRFRLVQPNEMLQAQGIALRTRAEVADFAPADLRSLAGNAFSAYTCQAMTVSAFSSFKLFRPLL